MKTPANRTNSVLQGKALRAIAFLLAIVTFAVTGASAFAASLEPGDYRVAVAGDKFDGTRQFAVAFKLRPPRRLRARHLELATGSISTATENLAFVSLGPVWRLPIGHRSLFIDLGFSPTLISGSTFNGRDLGGNFHFTSAIAVGSSFGQQQALSVSLRAQHISNGGLNDTNPGIDMVGINVSFSFINR